jgi:hypothetical protein
MIVAADFSAGFGAAKALRVEGSSDAAPVAI